MEVAKERAESYATFLFIMFDLAKFRSWRMVSYVLRHMGNIWNVIPRHICYSNDNNHENFWIFLCVDRESRKGVPLIVRYHGFITRAVI